MCGIAGFIDRECLIDTVEGNAIVQRMSDRIAHRGPDDSGTWSDPAAGAFLGHRRLAILDLSPAGHQPMISANGRYVLAFNGEIYNHQSIRKTLPRSAAISWRGHSDTEVLLAAIEAWGLVKTLQQSIGMFAMALWDREERKLWLARDRIGEKPLYWGQFGKRIIFGSELKSLVSCPYFEQSIDKDALGVMLRYGYVPAPFSIYRGVQKVIPGTTLCFDVQNSIPDSHAYWSPHQALQSGRHDEWQGSDSESIDELERRLNDAIGLQLQADVPVGTFLSGGVDSSVIAALAQALSNRPLRTFSIGFEDRQYDEAGYARAVAEHLGTDHTELYVTARQAMDVIPLLPSIYDEPFADSSQIPTFLVSRLARQSVTVSLSGDGGDELFSGYNRYAIGQNAWKRVHSLPAPARRLLAQGFSLMSSAGMGHAINAAASMAPSRWRPRNPAEKLGKISRLLRTRDMKEMYLALISNCEKIDQFVPGAVEPETAFTMHSFSEKFRSATEWMGWLDLVSYLPDDILVKVDRASMAVSLESRVPMLDHRVVEYSMCLPEKFKIRNGTRKWLLRQVLYRHVPKHLIERPKMGFAVPIASWLRGPLRDWAESLLSEKRLLDSGLLDPAPIRKKWQEHVSGKHDWHDQLWGVLAFQAWLSESQPSLKTSHA